MPIIPSGVPKTAVDAVQAALKARVGRESTGPSRLSNADPKYVSVSFPHQTAYLSLSKIEPRASLRDSAQLGNWRFLVEERQSLNTMGLGPAVDVPIASVTVAPAVTGTFRLIELNEGPFVKGTTEAIRRAEALHQVQNGRFEAVLLVVPAVYVVGLWLQSTIGGDDIILAIPPSDSALGAYKPMTTGAFMDILAGLAAAVRRIDIGAL